MIRQPWPGTIKGKGWLGTKLMGADVESVGTGSTAVTTVERLGDLMDPNIRTVDAKDVIKYKECIGEEGEEKVPHIVYLKDGFDSEVKKRKRHAIGILLLKILGLLILLILACFLGKKVLDKITGK
jgi:hypothetical protein